MKKLLNSRAILSLAVGIIRVFPRASRFGIGKLAAKILTPFAHKFSLISRPPFALDASHDYVWSVLFMSLTLRGVEFDPKIVFRDSERVLAKGAILVSGHFFLNFFVLRWLHDQGFQQSTVIRESYDRQKVFGTKEEIDVIKPDAGSLREIRRRVRRGEIISICIDHCEPFEGWRKIDIPERQIYISESIFEFARRFGIPLVFFGTQLNSNDEIEVYTRRPVSTEPSEVAAEFGEFLKSLLVETENKQAPKPNLTILNSARKF